MKEIRVPKDVYESLKLKEPKEIEKEMKLIEDKGQFIVRIPTVFNEILGLDKNKKDRKVKVRMHGKNSITIEVLK